MADESSDEFDIVECAKELREMRDTMHEVPTETTETEMAEVCLDPSGRAMDARNGARVH